MASGFLRYGLRVPLVSTRYGLRVFRYGLRVLFKYGFMVLVVCFWAPGLRLGTLRPYLKTLRPYLIKCFRYGLRVFRYGLRVLFKYGLMVLVVCF